MDAPRRHTERVRASREALTIISSLIEPAIKPGWYGEVRLALEVQDGQVMRVRDRGPRRTHQVGSKRAA